MIVLGVETSCDETGLALYDTENGLLGQVLYSQIKLHQQYGGVIPELASRDHIRKLIPLIEQLMTKAQTQLSDLGGIAYTQGPGLVGALMTGALFARTLAYALNIPAVGVHHMEGHLLAPFINHSEGIPFPFVALLVSGGHTQLVHATAFSQYQVLGESVDDAAGEAFDKVAKMMELPYPGGPAIAKLAESGYASRFAFPRPMQHTGLNFSFSGLKTAVLNQYTQTPDAQSDIAASFQAAAVDVLVTKSIRALEQVGCKHLVIAGGVSANTLLRQTLEAKLKQIDAQVYYAPVELCTDNGAMIAFAGAKRLAHGQHDDLSVQTVPRWPLNELT